MPSLVIKPVNGLCNRLRSMASGWILATHLNREFKVIWEPSNDIGFAKFTDLFEYENWLLDQEDIDLNDESCYTEYTSGVGTVTEMNILSQICSNNTDMIILNKTGGNYKLEEMSLSEFNSLKSKFYQSLRPIRDIREKVKKFSNDNQLNNCLGVHIRRTDRRSFTPKTEMFAVAIKRHDAYKKVFLCTDDESEIKKLSVLISKNIVTFPKKKYERNTIESVQEALLEWLLLGMCNDILFSHGSSYGYEACVCGKKGGAFEMRSVRDKTENERRNLPPLVFS